ncbi:hypothetical protein ABIB73_001661 [Bradyrhizobium sp. F1.4.3]
MRGCFQDHGQRQTRGESPSPGLHLRCNPTSPRKRGEVKKPSYLTVNSTGIEKLIEPFLISSGNGGNGEAWRIIDVA